MVVAAGKTVGSPPSAFLAMIGEGREDLGCSGRTLFSYVPKNGNRTVGEVIPFWALSENLKKLVDLRDSRVAGVAVRLAG